MLSIFFVGTTSGFKGNGFTAIYLTLFILLGINDTCYFPTIVKNNAQRYSPHRFTLELPPYRNHRYSRLCNIWLPTELFCTRQSSCIRSSAGLIIWIIMANVTIGNKTLLLQTSDILGPFESLRLLGLDGVILLAFILDFPAKRNCYSYNNNVIYMANGTLIDSDAVSLGELLRNNGWTWTTAVSMMLFSLMHWPCSTTLFTIKRKPQA